MAEKIHVDYLVPSGALALRQEFHCRICVIRKNVTLAALAVNGVMTHLHGNDRWSRALGAISSEETNARTYTDFAIRLGER